MAYNACGVDNSFIFIPDVIEMQEDRRAIILQQRNRNRVDALAHTYIQLPIYNSTFQVTRDPF
jgi:hypothetical protein